MPLYKADKKTLTRVERTTFKQQGLRERRDIQALMKSQIDAISPNTLIVAEEFNQWDGSKLRIDLLGIDKDANLVVIELKRTEDGGLMELQAIRYAAMISTMTFDKLVPVYQRYLDNNKTDEKEDAKANLLKFLERDKLGEIEHVKIVLASAEFSKELTTSVMWLNEFKLGIRCVRMRPYKNGEQILLDIQTIIPLPEVADYQIQIQEKKQKEREAKKSARDYTKYDVHIAGQVFENQNKRQMMFQLLSRAIKNGATPQELTKAIGSRWGLTFQKFDGPVSSEKVKNELAGREKHFHCEEDELLRFEGDTYALNNQWGDREFVEGVASKLSKLLPDLKIKIEPIE